MIAKFAYGEWRPKQGIQIVPDSFVGHKTPQAHANRMRNAHILLITIRALANEVAKNLVLAGIGSLTVLDPDIVTEDDLGGQFFIGEEHIGINVCCGVTSRFYRQTLWLIYFITREQ